MKKKLIFLICALGVFACKKNDDKVNTKSWSDVNTITYHAVEISELGIIADTFWVKSNSLDDQIGYIDHGFYLTNSLPLTIDLGDRVLEPSDYFSLEFFKCKPVNFFKCAAQAYITFPSENYDTVPDNWVIDHLAFKVKFDVTFN